MRVTCAHACYGWQEGEALLRRVPELDLVMGPQHANRIHTLLDDVDLGSQVSMSSTIIIAEDRMCVWV